MAANANKVSAPAVRRPVAHGVRSSHAHGGGRWKLVYADFVTVLMAFFIVAWIFVFDLLSKERRVYDRTCTDKIGREAERKLSSEAGPDRTRWPIEVDFAEGVGGTRFTLVDVVEPMFDSGSARLSKFASPHLDTIAQSINQCPGLKVKIEGYTDAVQYAGGEFASYSNWELSVDRANTARRELLQRGINSERIEEVTGYGDSKPALPEDPGNARNRRISITVLATYTLAKGWNDVVESEGVKP